MIQEAEVLSPDDRSKKQEADRGLQIRAAPGEQHAGNDDVKNKEHGKGTSDATGEVEQHREKDEIDRDLHKSEERSSRHSAFVAQAEKRARHQQARERIGAFPGPPNRPYAEARRHEIENGVIDEEAAGDGQDRPNGQIGQAQNARHPGRTSHTARGQPAEFDEPRRSPLQITRDRRLAGMRHCGRSPESALFRLSGTTPSEAVTTAA